MLMHDDTRKALTRLLELVQQRIAALPAGTYEQRHERNKAIQDLEYDLEQKEGARFGELSGSHTFSLAGIRASSTISIESALQNWCVNVRKRLGGGS